IVGGPKEKYEIRVFAVGIGEYKNSEYSEDVKVTTPALMLEEVTLNMQNPGVNRKVTALLMQENLTATYQWYRGTDSENVDIQIEGATESSYVATVEDEGYYLKVVAIGVGKTEGVAEAVTAEVVTLRETVSELVITESQFGGVGDVSEFWSVTDSVTEWDAVCAEIRLKNTDFGAGETVTQSFTYDSTLFQMNWDSLQVADDWSREVRQETGTDGRVTVTFSLTAECYGVAEKYVLASVILWPTGRELENDTEVMGVKVQKMRYDINGNAEVDILDLVEFSRYFNTSESRADFDSDGKVTILDLVKFSRQFGKKKPKMNVVETEMVPVSEMVPETVVKIVSETVAERKIFEVSGDFKMVSRVTPVSVSVRDSVFAEMKDVMEDKEEFDWRMLE
ncbi:MAG: dockerin type I domain-containing protein, partial [Planctomycetia bacterium]|nr:dockerin type I domain-containing protein [Planctomycetia bacterium]